MVVSAQGQAQGEQGESLDEAQPVREVGGPGDEAFRAVKDLGRGKRERRGREEEGEGLRENARAAPLRRGQRPGAPKEKK